MSNGFYVVLLIIVIVLFLNVKDFVVRHKAVMVPILIVLSLIAVFIIIRKIIRKLKLKEKEKRLENSYKRCNELFEIIKKGHNLEQAKLQIDELSSIIRNISVLYGEGFDNSMYKFKITQRVDSLHQDILRDVAFDRKLRENKKQKLNYFEEKLGIPPESITRNRQYAYRNVYESVIKDRVLSEEDEAYLSALYSHLGLKRGDLKQCQSFLRQLSKARQMTSKDLHKIEVPFALEDGENCYFSAGTSSFYKSYREDYVYYPLGNPEEQGELYITNLRLILSNPKAFSYWFKNIKRVEIYNDTYICIQDRDKAKPFFLKTPEPYVVNVVINKYLDLQTN